MYMYIFNTDFLKDFTYLFDTEKERDHKLAERQAEREWGSRLPAEQSPMWGSIPGPWDHGLSQRQRLNNWATQAPLDTFIFKWLILCMLFFLISRHNLLCITVFNNSVISRFVAILMFIQETFNLYSSLVAQEHQHWEEVCTELHIHKNSKAGLKTVS